RKELSIILFKDRSIFKEKTNLAISFYNSINPIFTEEYFREIAK
ncbi:unnamed protein product, partial [marine sediment metagenome]